MSNYTTGNVGKEMGAVPFGDLLSGMALGIAEGQWALDKSSIRVTELMSGQRLLRDMDSGKLIAPNGDPLPYGAEPHLIDSRVYFGYDYVNQDAEARVSSVDDQGGILEFEILNHGADYAFAPQVEINGGDGTAQAKVTMNQGRVATLTINNNDKERGRGYKVGDPVAFLGGGGKRVPRKLSMMELGFTPNFYQFVDTIIEIKIVVKMMESKERSKKERLITTTTTNTTTDYHDVQSNGWSWWHPQSSPKQKKETKVVTQTVDPAFSNKYNYSVEGSSMIRTKLVPVPPPTILEERIRQLMETEENFRNEQLRSENHK